MRNIRQYTEADRKFFSQPPEEVAPWLLGKILCRRMPDGKVVRLRITETEAYPGSDFVCYGRGKDGKEIRTEATIPLFQAGGTCCIYAGMLLISCGKEETPENVLIRCAGDPDLQTYFDGPMKVFQALKVNKADLHGKNLLELDMLWLADDGAKRDYCCVPRLRLSRTATKEEKEKGLRFISL